MPRVWQKLGSLLKTANSASAQPSGTSGSDPLNVVPIVALIVNEQDRGVVARIAGGGKSNKETWQVHFAESCEELRALAERLCAPVILIDRDWPGMAWKTTVLSLAALPHHACVILVSGVADTYLWQELVRQDGYDILAKPLRFENVLRVVKLALSYWSIRTQRPVAVTGRK